VLKQALGTLYNIHEKVREELEMNVSLQETRFSANIIDKVVQSGDDR
jgi:hypothetical protein